MRYAKEQRPLLAALIARRAKPEVLHVDPSSAHWGFLMRSFLGKIPLEYIVNAQRVILSG